MSDDTETVARIWRQLGSPNYEALNGRSIHDLIDELLANQRPPDFDGPETGGKRQIGQSVEPQNPALVAAKIKELEAGLVAVRAARSAWAEGRRAGLEDAAKHLDAEALEARQMAVLAARADDDASEAGFTALAYNYENRAAAIRALGRPA